MEQEQIKRNEGETAESFSVRVIDAALKDGAVKIKPLTGDLLKAAFSLEKDFSEILDCLSCGEAPISDETEKELTELFTPLREAVFSQIGLFISYNSFSGADGDGL